MAFLTLGLTGPTGAGKTTVSSFFSKKDIPSVNCDLLSRKVVEPGQPALKELVQVFGSSILLPDGSLDRRGLAAVAFPNPLNRRQMEEILYPGILKLVTQEIQQARLKGKRAILVDAPTLYESGADQFCDRVLAVLAPFSLRMERIMARDGLSRQQALIRIKAQQTDAFYLERAQDILYNDGEPEKLEQQLVSLYRRLFP